MLVVSTLFAWLALASLCEAGYVQQIFSQDGWGAANPFLYPQMTAAVDAVTYAIYHYSVNGVDGNAGISLVTESGMLYRNFPIIMPSQTNPPVNPPYNFINDSFVGQFPYHAEYMYGYYNATTNQHLIEMIIPVEIPISGGHQMQMVGMIIDYFGHYVGPLTTPSLQVSVPYQVSGQPMSQLTVTHNPSSRTIVVGGVNQPFMQTINLTQYWHHADGCITLAADIKVLNPTDPANAALVVLLDNSQQAYPSVDQVILIINPYTGVLLDKIDTGIYYDVNSLVTYGRRQVTLTPDNRIMVVPPSTYQQRSVYRWTQNSAWGALTVPNGYVEKVWFTNLGYLQGQAVLSDSTVVTTRISETDTTAQTTAVVITNPATQQVISQFSTITGLTPAAIAAGAVANINGYMIVAISADANDNLYLSNYWQNGYNTGRAPGVLVVSKTGQFIDWYTGFQLPQTVSFDRQGHMLVPDRFGDVVYVINTTTHTTVSTPSCPGCLGVAIDSVNGGYVATTSVYWQNTAAIRFMDSSFAFVSALGTIPFSFNSFGDQAALSNPVVDSQGRIYVLVSQYAGLTRSSAVLKVYNPSTRALILQHGFANAQPRGYPGISQLRYGLSLSIDQNSQAIVASTINFGQIFKTKPL